MIAWTSGCADSHVLGSHGDGSVPEVDGDVAPACEIDAPSNCRATLPVPAGSFFLGDPRELEVTIDAVSSEPAYVAVQTRERWISRYKTTNACWSACLAAGECHPMDEIGGNEDPLDPDSRRFSSVPRYADYAAHLSLPGARRYCAWLGGRMVTEAEWMKMARGSGGRVLPWAEDPPDPLDPDYVYEGPGVDEVVGESWRVQFIQQVAAVGENLLDVGPYGHRDLAGLLAEWTSDAALPYDPEQVEDPVLAYPSDCPRTECVWHVVMGQWWAIHQPRDLRLRAIGSNVDFEDEENTGPRVQTGFAARCAFDAEPPPLCVGP